MGIVGRLWAETGNLGQYEAEDLLSELYGLCLLLELDLDQRIFRLHDTVRHLLQDQAGKERLIAQQKGLVRAFDDIRRSDQADALSRRYFYLYLPYHLAEAKDREALDALLLDPGWLTAKLEATSDPQALVADYNKYGVGEVQNFIGRTLRLTAGIVARDQRQLIPQLLGRLVNCNTATGFLAAARRELLPPAIVTRHPSLTPPGAESARLDVQSGWLRPLCVLPDGRLATGSDTIQLWDVKTGAETGRLEDTRLWSARCAYCPTDGSPQAPGTKRSGYGM
jgi:hypothetical protein